MSEASIISMSIGGGCISSIPVAGGLVTVVRLETLSFKIVNKLESCFCGRIDQEVSCAATDNVYENSETFSEIQEDAPEDLTVCVQGCSRGLDSLCSEILTVGSILQ